MRKRLLIVLLALLFSFGFVAGCGEGSENSILALGVKNLKTTQLEVGTYPDLTGVQLAIVFENEPEEVKVFDLTWDMIDSHSYDVTVPGVKNIVVNYVFEGKTYSTTFTVEYFQNEYKVSAIKEIESYKAGETYSAEKKILVEAYKALGVLNVKLSTTPEEAASIVDSYKSKINSIPTKTEEVATSEDSLAVKNAKEKALAEMENYKLKDANGQMIVYPDLYAQIIASSRTVAMYNISSAKTLEDVNIALLSGKATIDNAAAGSTTLDTVNEAKIAAETAKAAAEQAEEKAAQALANVSKLNNEANEAKIAAEKASETALANANAAINAKNEAEAIKNEIGATKAQIDAAEKAAKEAEAKAAASQALAEEAKVKAEEAQTKAESAQAKAEAAQTAAETAKSACERAVAAAEALLAQVQVGKELTDAAKAGIASVNDISEANYTGLNLLLVKNIKSSYVAKISATTTDEEIQPLVEAAIAEVAAISTDSQTEVIELEAEQVAAKEEISDYIRSYIAEILNADITTLPDPIVLDDTAIEAIVAAIPYPTTISAAKVEQMKANLKEAVKTLVPKIEAFISETEAAVDTCTTVQEVETVLAKMEGKLALETILCDYYSSELVKELGIIFRANYESKKASFSTENYDAVLGVKDYYDNLLGRLDKMDELANAFDKGIEDLGKIKTQSGQIADMIMAITYPITIYPTGTTLADYTDLTISDSMRDELKPIADKMAEFDAVDTSYRAELAAYDDPENPGQTINLLEKLQAANDRYQVLVNAKADANANTAFAGTIALINAIPGYDLLTLNAYRSVNAAEGEYDNANDEFETWKSIYEIDEANIRIIVNLNVLTAAKERLTELENAKANAETAETGVIALITKIFAEEGYVYLDCETLIDDAREAYDLWATTYNINDANKYLVPNYTDPDTSDTNEMYLESAEARLAELLAAKANAETETTGVIALIDAILADDEYVTLADEAELLAAEAELATWKTTYNIDFDAEPKQREIISNLVEVEAIRGRYDELVDAKADAETETIGVIAVIAALNSVDDITLNDEAAIVAARTTYDTWINDWFTTKTYNGVSIDAANEPLNTAIVTNYGKLEELEARITELKEAKAAAETADTGVIALIDKTDYPNGYVTLSSEESIDAAREAYNAWVNEYNINTVNEYLVTNYADLEAAETRLADLKEAKAAAEADGGVIELIEAVINEEANEYITLADEDDIIAAETSYDAWINDYFTSKGINAADEPLNTALVTNGTDLEAYRDRYDELVRAQADSIKPQGVNEKVNAIGTVTLDSKDVIDDARNSYDQWLTDFNIDPDLEPINNDIVPHATLTAAEAKYAALVEQKDLVIQTIAAIGDTTLDSEAAIIAAEQAYVALVEANDGVSAITHVTNYSDMIDARADYEYLVFVQYRENAQTEITAERNRISLLVGENRRDTTLTDISNVSVRGQADILAVSQPTDSNGADVLGAWDRTVYAAAIDSIKTEAFNKMLVAAKYIFTVSEEEEYALTIYAAGSYTSFVNTKGNIITTVETLVVDALVGTGHVEITGITVTGDTIINGGGSSSVVFINCALGNVKVNYDNVKVSFDTDTTVNDIAVSELTSVKLVFNGQTVKIHTSSNLEIEGTSATIETIELLKNNLIITTSIGGITFEADETVDNVSINGKNTGIDGSLVITENFKFELTPEAIVRDNGNTGGENLTATVEESDNTTIFFGGANEIIEYYGADPSLGRTAGHRVGVKISAPAIITDFTGFKLTIGDNEYDVDALDGTNFFYWYPLVTEANKTFECTVVWNSNYEGIVYTIEIVDGTLLEGKGGSIELTDSTVNVVNGNEMTIGGADLAHPVVNDRHEVAVKVNAPSWAQSATVATVLLKIGTGEFASVELVENGFTLELVQGVSEYQVQVKWSENSTVETFTIKLAEGYVLEVNPVDIEKDYATGGLELDYQINGTEITYGGNGEVIEWYPEDSASGRAEGHRVGVKISAPAWISTLEGAKLVIGSTEYGAEAFDSQEIGNVWFYYYPLLNADVSEYTVKVTWNKYVSEVTYKIIIAEGTAYALPPQSLSQDSAKTGGELTTSVEGNTITFGAAGEKIAYYPNNFVDGLVAGHYVAVTVKVSKQAFVDNGFVLTVAGVNYTREQAYMTGEYELTVYLKVNDEIVASGTSFDVKWNSNIAAVTYNVSFAEGTDISVSAGVLSEDDAKIAGQAAVATVNGDTITFSGSIAYSVDGYYVGIKIVPDAQTGAETYTETFKLTKEIIENGIEIKKVWSAESGKEFVYHVEFAADIKFAMDPSTASKITNGFENLTVTIDGYAITVGAEGEFIPWFNGDSAVGRAEGHRIGIRIVPATNTLVDADAVLVTVDGKTVAFYEEFLTTDNGIDYWPILNPNQSQYTFTVKWNEYSPVETFTITINENCAFATPLANSVTVTGLEIVELGEDATYTASVLPTLASQDVVWSVDDTTVATISENGVLSTLKAGTVVVKATAGNGVFGTITVEVASPEVTSVEVSGSTSIMFGDTDLQYTAAVSPIFANQNVVWSVNDTTIATIDADGVLTPIKAGTVVVKATADNEVFGTIEVKIIGIADLVALTTAAITEDSQVKAAVKGVVVTWQFNGYWIADETGTILVYTGLACTEENTPAVGDYVLVSGKLLAYNSANRFTTQIVDSTYTVLEDTKPTINLEPTESTIAASYELGIDTYEEAKAANLYGKIITIRGTISGSGKFWKINGEDGQWFYISNAYSTAELKAGYEAVVTVLVREVYFVDDESNYNNYNQGGLGGLYLSVSVLAKDFLVSEAFSEQNDTIVVDGVTYVNGVTGFTTLAIALENAVDGQTIRVAAGTYTGSNIVTKNNITILGPNADINPTSDAVRNPEAILTGIISATDINGLTVNGFKFQGMSNLQLRGDNCFDITFINNIMDSTSQYAIVRAEVKSLQNIVISYNYSNNYKATQFIYLFDVVGLEMIGNSITTIEDSSVQSFLSAGKISGIVNISENYFCGGQQAFIITSGVGVGTFTIENNYVKDVTKTAIDFRTMRDDGDVVYNIRFNVFENTGSEWMPIRIWGDGYDGNDTITINVEYNQFIESYKLVNEAYCFVQNPPINSISNTFKQIYTIGRNYYVVNGVAYTALTADNFSGVAITFAEAFATVEELNEAIKNMNNVDITGDFTNNKETGDKVPPAGWELTSGRGSYSTKWQAFSKDGNYALSPKFSVQEEVTVSFTYYLNNYGGSGNKSSKVKFIALDANGDEITSVTSKELNIQANESQNGSIYETISATLKGTGIVQIKVQYIKDGGGNIGYSTITVKTTTTVSEE